MASAGPERVAATTRGCRTVRPHFPSPKMYTLWCSWRRKVPWYVDATGHAAKALRGCCFCGAGHGRRIGPRQSAQAVVISQEANAARSRLDQDSCPAMNGASFEACGCVCTIPLSLLPGSRDSARTPHLGPRSTRSRLSILHCLMSHLFSVISNW